jgi:cytochrome c556
MRSAAILASIVLLGLAGCGGNPDTPAGRAADARHESFEQMGDAFKVVADAMKQDAPDMAAIQSAAGKINALAPKLPEWFPAGSGPDDGIRTEALQTVWTKPEEFRQAAQKFADEAAKFDAAAKTGDKAAVGAAMQSLGGSCKGCHEKFREAE